MANFNFWQHMKCCMGVGGVKKQTLCSLDPFLQPLKYFWFPLILFSSRHFLNSLGKLFNKKQNFGFIFYCGLRYDLTKSKCIKQKLIARLCTLQCEVMLRHGMSFLDYSIHFPNLCNSWTLRCYIRKFPQVQPKSIQYRFLDIFSFHSSGAISVKTSLRCDLRSIQYSS